MCSHLSSNEDLAGSAPDTGCSRRKLLRLRLELVITGGVYWFLLLMLRSFRGQDLNYVPGGKFLRMFGKALRLF